jgi:hypothetical protein
MSVGSSGSSTSSQGLGYLNTATTLAGLLGTSNTSLTSLGAPVTLTGLSSGVDTSEIIAELMQVNEIPQQQLTTQLNSASAVLGSYQALSTDIATLQSVSDTLASPSGWQAWIPNSTTEDATATVGDGAIGGSITFSVDSLAQADSQISSGSVTSESAQVTSGPLLVAVGGGGLGVSTLSSSNLSIGNHTIAVTQASAGASLTSGERASRVDHRVSSNEHPRLRSRRQHQPAEHRRRYLHHLRARGSRAISLGRGAQRQHQYQWGHGADDNCSRKRLPRSR